MATKNIFTRQLYYASAASANDGAHLDLPMACYLVGALLSIQPTAVASGDAVHVEISTGSTGQATTNDAQNILAMADYEYILTTSGIASAVNQVCPTTRIYLPAGTRIYMHTLQTGTSSTRCRALLHLLPA